MTAVTTWGGTADPEECREIAAMIDAGAEGWRDRVAALPRCVLTRETLASEPEVIAGKLRLVARYLEDRRAGLPFGHKFAAQLAAKAAVAEAWRQRTSGKMTMGKLSEFLTELQEAGAAGGV